MIAGRNLAEEDEQECERTRKRGVDRFAVTHFNNKQGEVPN